MVALLVRLKLTLLKNSLKRSVWRTVGLILGMLYALGAVLAVLAGLFALRFTSEALTADVTVLFFSFLTLGWLLMSLLVFGVDETVDPSKFALLPVRAKQLQPGLFVAGLVGSPGIATVLISAGLVIAWARSPALAVGAVVAFPLGAATCFLLSRAGTAAFASFLASRRFRDFAFVALALFGAVMGIGGNIFGGLASEGTTELRGVLAGAATVAGWTPFGWAWAVALVGVLWIAWGHFLGKRLVEPIEPGGDARKVRQGTVADRLFPASAAGGIARRTLWYWRRDPRYLASIAGFLIAPIVILVAISRPDGSPTVAAFAPALLAGLIGITVATDLSYDGTAIWLHISSGISGADDRRGRIMSSSVIFGPLVVVLVVVAMMVTGEWRLLAPVAATTLVLALAGIGVGAWVGALWQWPAPPPGANPFQKGSSGGLPATLSFSVASLATFVVSIPTLGLVVGSFWIPWLGYLAVAVAVVTGWLVMSIGISKGGAMLDRRWPEVMKAVSEKSA